MKKFLIVSITFFVCISLQTIVSKAQIIVDHNCTKLDSVPLTYVKTAMQSFRIAYGHTSHGSQITSGMSFLASKSGSQYLYNSGLGTLNYNETLLQGDLGNPDRTTWASSTRTLLNRKDNDRNMIMWSWCGQVSSSSDDNISSYLSLMNQLELDFPNIKFVYMTGHLDGTGESGNLNQRNNQIRDYCRTNNKILFDFADIESYDPDGRYFLDKNANDNCDYYDGNVQKNWAEEWCNANPGKCGDCGCAHSQCLNCIMKGNAFWWMLARISGWNGTSTTELIDDKNELSMLYPNPAIDYVTLNTKLETGNNIHFDIYNLLGNEVNGIPNPVFDNKTVTININYLESGVYFLKMSDKTEFEIFKIIKN